MKKINVLLADGNRLFIESLRIVILENPEYSVVGTVLSGVDAIKAIAELAPDVTVVGQILPDISILQVVKELRRNSKSTKFLFVLDEPSQDILKFISEVDSIGVVTERSHIDEFFKALSAVSKGEKYVSLDVLECFRNAGEPEPVSDILAKLTAREREVLFWLARGLTNREIASRMILSEKTVKNHVSHVLKKLDIPDRTKAAAVAWKEGLPMIPEEFFNVSSL